RELAEQLSPWTSEPPTNYPPRPVDPAQIEWAVEPPTPSPEPPDFATPEPNLDAADQWIANSSNDATLEFPAAAPSEPAAADAAIQEPGPAPESVVPSSPLAARPSPLDSFDPADDPVFPETSLSEFPRRPAAAPRQLRPHVGGGVAPAQQQSSPIQHG